MGRAPGLPDLTIHAANNADVLDIQFGYDVRSDRAEGVKRFGTGELDVAALNIAGGHIINAGETFNVSLYIVGILKAGAAFSDNDAELSLMFNLLGLLGNKYRFTVRDESRRRFLEPRSVILRKFNLLCGDQIICVMEELF